MMRDVQECSGLPVQLDPGAKWGGKESLLLVSQSSQTGNGAARWQAKGLNTKVARLEGNQTGDRGSILRCPL